MSTAATQIYSLPPQEVRKRSKVARIAEPLAVLTICSALGALCSDWLAAASSLLLYAAWRFLPNDDGYSVLKFAFTFQWTQVFCGLFYIRLTGRSVPMATIEDCRPMMILGLGCLAALAGGLLAGSRLLRVDESKRDSAAAALSWTELVVLYLLAIVTRGAIIRVLGEIPGLYEAVSYSTLFRYSLLFLIVRRLMRPRMRWGWLALVLTFEVVIGFTGYFASFREAEILFVMALVGAFDRRKVTNWIAIGGLAVVLLASSVVWMSIRSNLRLMYDTDDNFANSTVDQLALVKQLSVEEAGRSTSYTLERLDITVSRLWTVYYPGLALERVPRVLPYTHGAIVGAALKHIVTPRFLFPDKAELLSDSEMVRKYSGVWVPSTAEGTSIAFGYAIESYIDFGVPLMFLPIFLWGVFIGFAYKWFLKTIKSSELGLGFVAIVFWLAVYLFERSWIKTIGITMTIFIYMGALTLLFDRFLVTRYRNRSALRAQQGSAVQVTFERHANTGH